MTAPAPRIDPLTAAALDAIDLAVTLIDPLGAIIYYNPAAAALLDRKPEHIGRDVRLCHQPATAAKIDRLLAEFAAGRRQPLTYRGVRAGRALEVTVTPLVVDGRWKACLHQVVVLGSEG